MFLKDYLAAIQALALALGGDCVCCISNISSSPYGDSFHFRLDGNPDKFFVVWRCGLVERVYDDVWCNPTHREPIKNVGGKNLW